MSKLFKRIICICIAVFMTTAIIAPTAVSAAKNTKTESAFYYQRDPQWGYGRAGYSACYISSFAMILTNMGHKNATPADVYQVNGHSTYMMQSRITNAYDASWKRTSVSGKSNSYKINLTKKLLKENPQGVIVRNSSHTMIATDVTTNGNIVFNDPAYPNGDQIEISKTQHRGWGAISYIEVVD